MFPDHRGNYKNTVERNISKQRSLIFESTFSKNCSLSELIYYEALIFSLKFIFSKECHFHFLLSLRLCIT